MVDLLCNVDFDLSMDGLKVRESTSGQQLLIVDQQNVRTGVVLDQYVHRVLQVTIRLQPVTRPRVIDGKFVSHVNWERCSRPHMFPSLYVPERFDHHQSDNQSNGHAPFVEDNYTNQKHSGTSTNSLSTNHKATCHWWNILLQLDSFVSHNGTLNIEYS